MKNKAETFKMLWDELIRKAINNLMIYTNTGWDARDIVDIWREKDYWEIEFESHNGFSGCHSDYDSTSVMITDEEMEMSFDEYKAFHIQKKKDKDANAKRLLDEQKKREARVARIKDQELKERIEREELAEYKRLHEKFANK